MAMISRRTEKQLSSVQKQVEEDSSSKVNEQVLSQLEGLRAENKKLREKVLGMDRAHAAHGKEMEAIHIRMSKMKAKMKAMAAERAAAGGDAGSGPCRLVREEVLVNMEDAVKKLGVLEHARESEKRVLMARVRDRTRRLK